MPKSLQQNLSKLIETFNDRRVLTDSQVQEVLSALVGILAENKKGVESLNSETKQQLQEAVDYITDKHGDVINRIQADLSKTKTEIEKATKEQNARAFARLQELLAKVKIPKDGLPGAPGVDGIDGKDGSPDTAEQVRDKLETLKDEERLDAKHIKGWEKLIGTVKTKGKDMLVGGIRFFENLVDVSISNKRKDLLVQYSTTNNRWENGVALTVSTTAPVNPELFDIWIDVS